MKPRIICQMTSSIDGRQIVDRWTEPSEGVERASLRSLYDDVYGKLGTDGWVAGRTSMAQYLGGEHFPCAGEVAVTRPDHIVDRAGRPLAVGLDPKGKLRYAEGEIDGDHVVAVVGERVSEDLLADLRRVGASYVFAGPDGHDIGRAMDVIGRAFDVSSLALQGGGTVNSAFLTAGLIDEISLLVYPGLDGLAGIPSIFEHRGAPGERPARNQVLRHLSTETLYGGMVWLRYEVRQRDPQGSRAT